MARPMKVLVALEDRFILTPSGRIYTQTLYDYSFWQRYLGVFEEVLVLARGQQAPEAQPGWRLSDGPNVRFQMLPNYRTGLGYILSLPRIRRLSRQAVSQVDGCLLRVPGLVSSDAAAAAGGLGRPVCLEVVGDPWDSLGPGTRKSIWRPLARRASFRRQRRLCYTAQAALYVTLRALQRRYPPGPKTHAVGCSDVELPDEAIASAPRKFAPRSKPTGKLIFVGSLNQTYKGQDVLIKAMGECCRAGGELELTVIGAGSYQSMLQQLAGDCGLGGRVRFLGALPSGKPIWAQLRQADMFVLPSRQEGLPRAMVEAMAAGLPCIGSTVGGIPELLPEEDLVPPGDVPALALKLREVLIDAARLERMSARNLQVASEQYRASVLDQRRLDYFHYVRDLFEKSSDRSG